MSNVRLNRRGKFVVWLLLLSALYGLTALVNHVSGISEICAVTGQECPPPVWTTDSEGNAVKNTHR